MDKRPYNQSIFWVDTEKIKPNPYQPRRDFDEEKLRDLAESIRQYGILQPLVVTRKEFETGDGLRTEYELIAGERRLRAARLAGVYQVPVIIREGEPEEVNERVKLEIAIIENVQREDLNPIDRARAFKRLAEEFGFTHAQIATRISKSREFVSNSIRMLALPEEILKAIVEGQITEGHTRPLLMLVEKPEEQTTLFKEIIYKKLNVREAERISRHIAHERARKKSADMDPELLEIERQLASSLGTRVHIERREVGGGRVAIDFVTTDDLRGLLERIIRLEEAASVVEDLQTNPSGESIIASSEGSPEGGDMAATPETNEEANLYSVKNFTI
ncbi:MAG: ParB/RepB/Spo0J family partition protein [Parcubacteria group bacterium]|nr:ParB/RepB/Spo0J family partition protein [Parcubacteria group bacterium]